MAKKIMLETRSEPALYTLLGISCHLKDYRLSFLLNQVLDLEFIKMDDLLAAVAPRKTTDSFSCYFGKDDDHFNSYYLLSNRGEESVLLPELRQTDFLMLVEGPFKKGQKDQLLSSIRAIQNILTAFEIRFETIRNYENFLNDLELHFTNINRELKLKYSPLTK